MLHPLLQIAVLAVATSAISLTLAMSKMFYRPRGWVVRHSSFLGELVNCHYCTAHWVALGLCALYQPTPLQAWWPADLVVGWFSTVGLAALTSGAIHHLIPFLGGYAGEPDD